MNVPFSFSPARRLLASFVLLLIACDEPVEIPDAGSDGPDAGALMDASSGEDASTDGGDASSGALDGGESDAGTGASTPDGGSDGGAPDAGEPPDPPGTWRSVLFPRGWLPLHAGGGADAEGRFLPDFAYAGWHRGEARPPYGAGAPAQTVPASFGDGTTDATGAIQAAIDAACDAGGGVVQLPAGTFRVRLPDASARAAITIDCSHLVLRGEGPEHTRILIDDPGRLRNKVGIQVRGAGSVWNEADVRLLAEDVVGPSDTIVLSGPPSFGPGAWIVVRNDNTDAFRAEHRMDPATSGLSTLWPNTTFRGLWYLRRVVAVDGTRVTLDAPLHLTLRTRDGARAYAMGGFLEEVGLESFAIGMVENTATPGRTYPAYDDDYNSPGTTGYEVHSSRAIEVDRTHDAWIYDVDSFAPEENTESGAHVLSGGILLEEGASRITIEACEWARPQYLGGGGNGYLFHFQGHDALVLRSRAERARHGFIFNHASNGNVLREVRVVDSRYSDDAHRFLAHANLYDRVELDRGWLQAVNRGTTSSGAGFTSTQHVFWNTHVIANHPSADGCAVESAQWGHGALIGSRAEPGQEARLCPMTFSNRTWAALDQGAPEELVEGEGMGETLHPPSLHAAQLALRCAREGRRCVSW